MIATRLSILTIAAATVAAGCGSHQASRSDAAVAACKLRIQASTLPPALKDELKKSCSEVASGDGMTAQAQITRREVCRKLVLERTPPGPARQRGLAVCAANSRVP